jgi:uncharacterized protein (UPF0335 family)
MFGVDLSEMAKEAIKPYVTRIEATEKLVKENNDLLKQVLEELRAKKA